jgi:hypothetical protein
MEDLPDFESGQIAGAHLAGAAVIKTAILLAVSRGTIPMVTLACTIMGKHQ